MNPSLLDPNNHVPEVSEGDGWDDPDGFADVPSPVLPPRRMPVRAVEEKREPVLRIEPAEREKAPDDSPHRLEVREFQTEIVRLDPSEPVPEKVPRQTVSHQRPSREEMQHAVRGESHEWGRVQRRPLRWLVAGGIGVAAAVVAVLALLPKINATNPVRPPEFLSPLPAAAAETVDENSLFLRQEEGRRLFERYLRAVSVDGIVPLVRDGPALREILRENWHPTVPPPGWEVAADCVWNVYRAPVGRDFATLSGFLPDYSPFTAYFVVLADGSLAADWKATTGYGSASFEDLAAGTGDAGEIRGTISLDNFYTANWPESDFQSYRFLSPGGDHPIWCYARRGSVAEAGVSRPLTGGTILQEADRSRDVTLHLARGGDETRPDQWLITEMLHLGWAAP